MKNLTGKRFGRLVVIKETKKRARNRCVVWECKCDCGRTTFVQTFYLRSGGTKSCGCLRREITEENAKVFRKATFKEGTHLYLLRTGASKTSNTGVIGVSLDRNTNKYRAYIRFKSKLIRLGRYENLKDAIAARQRAEEIYFTPILAKYNLEIKKVIADV